MDRSSTTVTVDETTGGLETEKRMSWCEARLARAAAALAAVAAASAATASDSVCLNPPSTAAKLQCLRGGESSSTAAAAAATRTTSTSRTLVRMLWVRHGLSCANVLDKCLEDSDVVGNFSNFATGEAAREWRSEVDAALQRGAVGAGGEAWYKGASVDWEWGIRPRGWGDARGLEVPDCVVRLTNMPPGPFEGGGEGDGAGGRAPGVVAADGDLVRLHDIYRDPSLTTCSIHQSRRAGAALRSFLREQGIKLDLVGSSTLLRAAQTAYHMFLEEWDGSGGGGVQAMSGPEWSVVQLPYIDERAPEGMSTIQLDNMPMPAEEQTARLLRDVNAYAQHRRPAAVGTNGTAAAAGGRDDGGVPIPPVDGSLVRPEVKAKRGLFGGKKGKGAGQTGGHPRGRHDWDRFKAFLALELLPNIEARPAMVPDAVLAAAIEAAPAEVLAPTGPAAGALAGAVVGAVPGAVAGPDAAGVQRVFAPVEVGGRGYRQGAPLSQSSIVQEEVKGAFDRVVTIAVVVSVWARHHADPDVFPECLNPTSPHPHLPQSPPSPIPKP